MAEQKFKVGQTVSILYRNLCKTKGWENSNAGGEGVIELFASDKPGYEDTNVYSLLLLNDNGKPTKRCFWFEEKYLKLYCSNEARGLKLLEKMNMLNNNIKSEPFRYS